MFQENQEIDEYIKQDKYIKQIYEFFWAAQIGNVVGIESYLASGMDVDVTNSWGSTALLMACENNHEAAVILLLKNGANTNQATEENDNSPLISVCSNGNTTIARLLLDAGAKIDQTDSIGRTPLFHACWDGHTKTAKLLVHRGADIQKATTQAIRLHTACEGRRKEEENGQTPLYVACYHKHVPITELLIASNKFAGHTPEQLKEIIYSSAHSYYANDIIFKDMLYFSVVCYRCHKLLGTHHDYDKIETRAIRAGKVKYNSQTKILLSIFSKRKEKCIETMPREICQEVVNYLPLVWLKENSQTPTNNETTLSNNLHNNNRCCVS